MTFFPCTPIVSLPVGGGTSTVLWPSRSWWASFSAIASCHEKAPSRGLLRHGDLVNRLDLIGSIIAEGRPLLILCSRASLNNNPRNRSGLIRSPSGEISHRPRSFHPAQSAERSTWPRTFSWYKRRAQSFIGWEGTRQGGCIGQAPLVVGTSPERGPWLPLATGLRFRIMYIMSTNDWLDLALAGTPTFFYPTHLLSPT